MKKRRLWANPFFINKQMPMDRITHLKTFNVKFCLFGVYRPTQEFGYVAITSEGLQILTYMYITFRSDFAALHGQW